jgi:membrane associated rhomboid family serine protease
VANIIFKRLDGAPMFFPIADTPNPPGRPLATWALVAVNVAVYLLVTLPASQRPVSLNDPLLYEYLHQLGLAGRVSAQAVLEQISAYDLLVFRYGFRPAEFSLVAMFSSLFLHSGLLHLAGNMLFLWIFGDNVEFRLGPVRFLLLYLICGVVATLFFAVFVPQSQVPLIGASGAISGILGCYFLWFPRNRVRCFLFLFPFLMTSIYLSARLVLGAFLLIDNLLPFLLAGNSGSGVAYGAHIGGFLGGLGLARVADLYYLQRTRVRDKVTRKAETPAKFSSLQDICPAVLNGDLDGAADCYLSLNGQEQRLRIDSADVMTIGNYLYNKKRFQEALQVFRRFIAERPNDSRIDQAYLGAGKSMLSQPRYFTSAYQYFLSAIDLARSEQLAAEATHYLRRIEQQRKDEKHL